MFLTLQETEHFCEPCLRIFEVLEYLFLSEHFQKSICGGVFSRVIVCSPAILLKTNSTSYLKTPSSKHKQRSLVDISVDIKIAFLTVAK